MSRDAAPVDVYGDPWIYVCRCFAAHGVEHVCALCRATTDWRPAAVWVPLERCHTCLVDEREQLESQLKVVDRKLRGAVHATDPDTGKTVPPRFLTSSGWRS